MSEVAQTPEEEKTNQLLTQISHLPKAAVVLSANKDRVAAAIDAGEKLLAKVTGAEMTPEMDAECNNYLVKVKKTLEKMNSERMVYTKILDEVKGAFTSQEALLDPKKPETIYAKVQQIRNEYAKKVAEENAKAEAEMKRKLEKGKEAADLEGKMLEGILKAFNEYLFFRKKNIAGVFNEMTLDNVSSIAERLGNFPTDYPKEAYFDCNPISSFSFKLHTPEEVAQIRKAAFSKSQYESLCIHYATSIEEQIHYYGDRIMSRKQELQDKKDADDKAEALRVQAENASKAKKKQLEEEARLFQEEQDRIAKEIADRNKEEENKLAAEKADNDNSAAETGNMKKTEGEMKSLFDTTTAVSASAPTAQPRTGYNITVKHPGAWMLIFQFWWENEGKNLPTEKIGKTSMNQMLAYAEKRAHKDNVKIDNSLIVYEVSYKAIATKA